MSSREPSSQGLSASQTAQLAVAAALCQRVTGARLLAFICVEQSGDIFIAPHDGRPSLTFDILARQDWMSLRRVAEEFEQ